MRKRWLQTLHQLAKTDERIVFIGSDLSADPALKKFQADIGPRFFMEGVSEAHIVGMASGIASVGKVVFFNTIATFITRRCFEQNVIDLGLANANVRLLAGGGGLVYAPLGPTHLAIDDISIMRAIPNMTVIVPCDPDEIERAVKASIDHQGPIYFRVAKGGEAVVSRPEHGFEIGKAIVHRDPGEVLLIATGVLVKTALDAADALKERGISAGVVNVHTIKPFDGRALDKAISASEAVVTMEEHLVHGGLGSAVAELIAEGRYPKLRAFKRLGIPDVFPDKYGSQESLLADYGMSRDGVVETALSLLD